MAHLQVRQTVVEIRYEMRELGFAVSRDQAIFDLPKAVYFDGSFLL